ncbi:MAG: GNAT family N-acetyltransferase [Candidatus Aminicenantes bacterium]|nr:GNAT family N-acetyltransferase [Candidatus Aminicenantes bacterium]
MRVRKCCPEDIPAAVELARTLGLDYPGMESDMIWVAEESGVIVGLVALKKHPDCWELCGLGVDPRSREKGLGKTLVEALMAEAPADVHLATVIPGFFETCGFGRTSDVPATFPAKRKTSWCDGCPRERCTVMLRKKQ